MEHLFQMEDEIASAGALVGASWSGVKSMTATSGPGISLMQEKHWICIHNRNSNCNS